MTESEAREFLEAAYRAVFRRVPDAKPESIHSRNAEWPVADQGVARFAELLNACCYFLQGKHRARILDIGSTQNIAWYKALLPGVELVAADRPGGPAYDDPDVVMPVDLNTGDLEPLSAHTPYDLIVFTEALDHLSVNPVLVLRQLISFLGKGGVIYLTTPNFYRSENLAKIGRRENPLPLYPLANSDYHHHTREFSMAELLQLLVESGGSIKCWYFSDCWDEVPVKWEERANLVTVAGK